MHTKTTSKTPGGVGRSAGSARIDPDDLIVAPGEYQLSRWTDGLFQRISGLTGWLCGDCSKRGAHNPERRNDMKNSTYGRGAVVLLEALGIVVAYFAVLVALSYPVVDAAGFL